MISILEDDTFYEIQKDSTSINQSELSRPWKSRILVESESNHADRQLGQSWVAHFFRKENVKILQLDCYWQNKNWWLYSTAPISPVNNFWPN